MTETHMWAPMDPLGEALHFLRMTGLFYCRSELTAPWGLSMPAMPGCLWFHVVTAGRCGLDVEDVSSVTLSPGDFALVPHGQGHLVRTTADIEAPDVRDVPQDMVSDRYSLLKYGGGGAPTTLVCGVVRFDQPAAHSLIRLLPPVIHLDASSSAPHAEWMASTLRLIATEAGQVRPGGETIMTRLADILVIQAIRAWLERDPGARMGWLGALQDPQIGRAIMLVHRDPGRAWTVAALAAASAMSRSAFAARFTTLVGESPMHYVARWRMQLAATLLSDEKATLGEVADRLGYQSEAAFSRAFKRFVGVSPGAARRTADAHH